MRIRVDRSAVSFLPICACGWRGLPAISHGDALRDARQHELRAHPGEEHARNAALQHARRQRRAGGL